MVESDSSGSNSKPDWVGDWKAVDAKPDSVAYPPENVRIFFSITTDTLTSYFEANGECDIKSTEVDDVDGNVVTVIEDEDGPNPDTSKTRLETSNGMLTITPVETEDEPDILEITAEPADADPASILDCSSSSANADSEKTSVDAP